MRDAFDAFDTDGSGKLSVDEIGAALAQSGKKSMTPEDVAKLVKQIDKNQDGEVSFDEFEAICNIAPDKLPYGMQDLVDVFANSPEQVVDLGGMLISSVGGAAMVPVTFLSDALFPASAEVAKAAAPAEAPAAAPPAAVEEKGGCVLQ
jgi:hypothetical protein